MTTANERLRNQFRVWQKGKHVMLTIQNPDKKQINGRYIRKPAVEIGVIHLEASHEPLQAKRSARRCNKSSFVDVMTINTGQ